MRLLLISNSTNPGEQYLKYPMPAINDFLGAKALKAVFIPFAAVTFSFDEYEKKVAERFNELGIDIRSVHNFPDMKAAVEEADVIVTGGGNTWQLLDKVLSLGLAGIIKEKVESGTPYIGWSAGSNLACPTIMTTNDMPVVEPQSFRSLGLIPFQINPHYTDVNPQGHAGETREQRITEFIEVNRSVYVAGLREGTMLRREGQELRLIGERKMRIFRYGTTAFETGNSDDLSFLLK